MLYHGRAFASYDTLTEIDHEGNPQPSLAESREGNADGTWGHPAASGGGVP